MKHISQNKPISILSALIALTFAVNAQATNIAEIKVKGDLAVFKLKSPKSHALPACAAQSDVKDYWAADLQTHTGRAIYSMLITALSKETNVTVQSAMLCTQGSGYEKAESVEISHFSSEPDKLTFAGYSNRLPGNENNFGPNSPAFRKRLNQICNSKYSGSRMATWEEFSRLLPDLITDPAHTVPALWMPDGLQWFSTHVYVKNNQPLYSTTALLKDGNISDFSNLNYNPNKPYYSSCGNFQVQNNLPNYHTVVFENSRLSVASCIQPRRLACVR